MSVIKGTRKDHNYATNVVEAIDPIPPNRLKAMMLKDLSDLCKMVDPLYAIAGKVERIAPNSKIAESLMTAAYALETVVMNINLPEIK